MMYKVDFTDELSARAWLSYAVGKMESRELGISCAPSNVC